jgi:hypothetical protein
MELRDIRAIVTNNHAKRFRAYSGNGKSKVVRLWQTEDGRIAMMAKRKRNYGYELRSWRDNYLDWTDLKPVNHKEVDIYSRFCKRASDGLKMLTESGLWPDIKEDIERFLELPENKQRELVNDIATNCYEGFYKETYQGGKYEWIGCHQVFESFANKKCWKSIAWRKSERQEMARKVAECIKNGKDFSWKWTNGYDNSVEVEGNRAWFSAEYRNCGNGHYYLMFDATHAIFYEDD